MLTTCRTLCFVVQSLYEQAGTEVYNAVYSLEDNFEWVATRLYFCDILVFCQKSSILKRHLLLLSYHFHDMLFLITYHMSYIQNKFRINVIIEYPFSLCFFSKIFLRRGWEGGGGKTNNCSQSYKKVLQICFCIWAAADIDKWILPSQKIQIF